jgi:hypothetical protein
MPHPGLVEDGGKPADGRGRQRHDRGDEQVRSQNCPEESHPSGPRAYRPNLSVNVANDFANFFPLGLAQFRLANERQQHWAHGAAKMRVGDVLQLPTDERLAIDTRRVLVCAPVEAGRNTGRAAGYRPNRNDGTMQTVFNE